MPDSTIEETRRARSAQLHVPFALQVPEQHSVPVAQVSPENLQQSPVVLLQVEAPQHRSTPWQGAPTGTQPQTPPTQLPEQHSEPLPHASSAATQH
jgi:hypothetical protein